MDRSVEVMLSLEPRLLMVVLVEDSSSASSKSSLAGASLYRWKRLPDCAGAGDAYVTGHFGDSPKFLEIDKGGKHVYLQA